MIGASLYKVVRCGSEAGSLRSRARGAEPGPSIPPLLRSGNAGLLPRLHAAQGALAPGSGFAAPLKVLRPLGRALGPLFPESFAQG